MPKRAYFFPGRTTPVVAANAKQARWLKRRPKSDRIVAVRALKKGEGSGKGPKTKRWSRLRRDGKPPGKSSYRGRGLGPKPKRRRRRG